MLSNLPEPIRQEIQTYLAVENFTAAKALRDIWLLHLYEPEQEGEAD